MSSNSEEVWKDVRGYEGHYWVSDHGNIKSKFRMLKPDISHSGHLRVTLSYLGYTTRYQLHRIVAEHFVSGYTEGYVVDHKDRNPANNNASNLRWVTQRENCWNQKERKNKSGHKYVRQVGKKFQATVAVSIGLFDTAEEAHEKALEFRTKYDIFYQKYHTMKV